MISRGYYHGDKIMIAKKTGPKNPAVEYAKRALVQAVGRSSDQFMLRLPDGMRDMIAEMAERNGRSMNAEIVSALASYIAHDGEGDTSTIKSALAEMKQEIKLLRDGLQAERGRAFKADAEEVVAQLRAIEKSAEAELKALGERRKQKSPPE
jgi:hypothetical protein